MIGGDDAPSSRSGTPKPRVEGEETKEHANENAQATNEEDPSSKGGGKVTAPEDELELPTAVRVRLRRLEKLETRYHELLRSYRVAHARTLDVAAFEASLRENTPLTSISDPGALTEYLNQTKLKGDMVLDELKRVSSERDNFQTQSREAQEKTREAYEEVADLQRKQTNADSSVDTPSDPLTNRKSSLRGADSPTSPGQSEDLFSYDDELPRLHTQLAERESKILELESNIKTLAGDLSVARESTQSMVQTLEETTRDLNVMRDTADHSQSELAEQKELCERISEDLRQAKVTLQEVEVNSPLAADLEQRFSEASRELESLKSARVQDGSQIEELQSTIGKAKAEVAHHEKQSHVLNTLVKSLREQLAKAEDQQQILEDRLKMKEEAGLSQQGKVVLDNNIASAPSKKKRNKKKKLAQATDQNDNDPQPAAGNGSNNNEILTQTVSNNTSSLQQEIARLNVLLEEKQAKIETLEKRMKDQEDMSEEIETLRDDLVNVGSELVEAKDKVKDLIAEKTALEAQVSALEGELSELSSKAAAGSEEENVKLVQQFEDLKVKAATLQIDLSAAQQLASSRFRDLSEMRSIMQQAQPEMAALKAEVGALKSSRAELVKKDTECKQLEGRSQDLQSQNRKLSADIQALRNKISQDAGNKDRAEAASERAIQENRRLEKEKLQLTESLDKLSKRLVGHEEGTLAAQAKLAEIEDEIARKEQDSLGVREELDLRTAQYSSAQSLMSSMRDQTAEMAMQTKEARERCESLEEEIADAHRLLSERSREGETMRRLLGDIEGRADARTREMKERMDVAIEERDRAEDEASTASRRKGRELEELRIKLREAERSLRSAEEEKQELESTHKKFKKEREELERTSEQAVLETKEFHRAMAKLRDALDESERQARDLERQRGELRRSVEEAQHRLEKMQKSNKVRVFYLWSIFSRLRGLEA